jgi:hypothetical protein
MSKKTENVYKDMLGFLRVTHNRKDLNDSQKLNAILGTFGHDLNGLIEDEPFFLPRIAGYRKSL